MTKDKISDAPASLIDILKQAIEKELASYDYYHHAASVTNKPGCRRMFLQLAEMEKGHAAELMKQLSDLEAQLHIDKALTSSF